MGVTASRITSITIVYSTVYSGAAQWKHQSSESQAFVCVCVWGGGGGGGGGGDSPVTSEFPAQMTSNAENVSIWWRHHVSVRYDDPSAQQLAMFQSRDLVWN